MGISRVASEIQIYSAVYSPALIEALALARGRPRVPRRGRVCTCECACVSPAEYGRALLSSPLFSSLLSFSLLQDAGSRELHGHAYCSQKSHLFRNKVAYLAYRTDRGALAVTYLTFGQVARVELEFARRKVLAVFPS